MVKSKARAEIFNLRFETPAQYSARKTKSTISGEVRVQFFQEMALLFLKNFNFQCQIKFILSFILLGYFLIKNIYQSSQMVVIYLFFKSHTLLYLLCMSKTFEWHLHFSPKTKNGIADFFSTCFVSGLPSLAMIIILTIIKSYLCSLLFLIKSLEFKKWQSKQTQKMHRLKPPFLQLTKCS